ncbi:MAG: A/G-specific adenine glycosylase [Flavobacteriaceae bacterium]|nr:A/G-specific adenine glycosylase [Flavobacteriaceae bacterium]
MDFSNRLIAWYLQNQRDLPWRRTKDPYLIWLSEVILQQTRIAQGTEYFIRFQNQFPTIFDLAAASEDQVLKVWQGLGYYSRARNLHATARLLVKNYEGKFPENFSGLKQLKGIGDYTAAAIASICFNLPHAVVDGNVYRVLSRFFNIDTPINSAQGQKEFSELANTLLSHKQSGMHNEAIMELGALICTPKNYQCDKCPLQHSCLAKKNKNIEDFPVKLSKPKVRKRFFNYLVLDIDETHTVLEKRSGSDIWQNLYQFPLLESQTEIGHDEIMQSGLLQQFGLKDDLILIQFNNKAVIHKLTHQTIMTNFWIIRTKSPVKNAVNWNTVTNFAVPVVINNFLKAFKPS